MDLHAQDADVIQTRRLLLRPVVDADAPAIVDSLCLWDVTQWLTNVPFPYTVADAASYIAMVNSETTARFWAIDAGEGLIGMISVQSELGYWLNYAYHGQGLMSEAATAVVSTHFDRADDDLVSGYHLGNAASARVLEKLGFESTHIETKTQVATQEPVKLQRMILTKDIWKNR